MPDQPQSHPLGNCMTLLEVNDFILVTPSDDGTMTSLNWLGYNPGDINDTNFEKRDSLSYADIKLSKAVSITSKEKIIQGIIIVTSTSLEFVAVQDTKMQANATFPGIITSEIQAIAGADTQTGRIIFCCKDVKGLYFLTLDVTAANGDPQRCHIKDNGISGNIIQGAITGANLDTYVMLLVGQNDTLNIYAFDCGNIKDETAPCETAAAATAGKYSGSYNVNTVVAQLESQPWHHLVFTYADDSGAGYISAAHLFIDSHTAKPTLGITQAQQLDTSFAKPIRSDFRLAAGPLWKADPGSDSSVVPVIVAYSGTYQGISGCACLLMLEFDSTGDTFIQKSNYAMDTNDQTSFASNDIHIAAGVFSLNGSGIFGVLVAGQGTSLSLMREGKSSIKIKMVYAQPETHVFPDFSGDLYKQNEFDLVFETRADAVISAFQCDLTGQSIRLGYPKWEQIPAWSQLMAIIQAPPYDEVLFQPGNLPSLVFNVTTDKTHQININSSKSWQHSDDFGFGFSLGPFHFGNNINTMYGKTFDHLSDSAVSYVCNQSRNFSGQDQMIVLTTLYDIWVYPTYQKGDQPIGEIMVIFPESNFGPQQVMMECSDYHYGYLQKHEQGTLLSYVDSLDGNPVPLDKGAMLRGYSPDTQLFGGDVASQQIAPSANVTFNLSEHQINSDVKTKSWSLHQSTSYSAAVNFADALDLFDELPIPFGLNMNISKSDSYSKTDTNTTTVTYNQSMDITINYPNISPGDPTVNGEDYTFLVLPVVYQHKDMGSLMVAYQVVLTGRGWQNYQGAKPLKLMAVTPPTPPTDPSNPTAPSIECFETHSISFKKNGDKTDITVEVFNNSTGAIKQVVVELFIGTDKPVFSPVNDKENFYQGWTFPHRNTDTGFPKPLDKGSIVSLDPIDRKTVMFTQVLHDQEYVCVYVYSDVWALNKDMSGSTGYWRQYNARKPIS